MTIIIVVAAAGLVGSGIWLWRSGQVDRLAQMIERSVVESMVGSRLTVQQITLAGRHRAPPEELLAALAVNRGDPILIVDLKAAHARLQALGWVRNATLSRLLPDRLHIKIDERVPIARWQRQGEIVLIDGEGAEIAKHGLDPYRRLPRVIGKGAAPLAAGLLDVLAGEPELYRRVRWASLIRERRWDVGLTEGLIIRLPESDIRKEWQRLSRLQRSEKILSKDLALIDLRIPGRLILRLTESGRKAREALGNNT
jgi:cell division protein FtsQ